MNKSAKIILLVLAIILAVGGVMAFYSTIVSPPVNPGFKNQFVSAINNDISNIKAESSDDELNTSYATVTHELKFQTENSLLTNAESDELMGKFATAYTPLFVKKCNDKFHQSVWSESALKMMKDHISELQGLKNSSGAKVVGEEDKTSLNQISGVISDYYAARSAASVGGFSGLDAAKQKIQKAKHYANLSPIKNCTDLVNKLKGVASRLEAAHYSFLQGQVAKMANWRKYNQDSYDALALSVSEKIREYKNNAHSVYGKVSSVSALESRAAEYYGNASFDE